MNLNQAPTNKNADFITRKILLMLQAKSAEWPQKHREEKTRAIADGAINNDIYQYAGLIIQLITIWYRAFCFQFLLVYKAKETRSHFLRNLFEALDSYQLCPMIWNSMSLHSEMSGDFERESAKNENWIMIRWHSEISSF